MFAVMHVVYNLNVGGLENLVVEVSIFSKERKIYRPIICCLSGGTTVLSRKAAEAAIEVIFLNGYNVQRKLAVLKRLISLMREKKLDLVHTHNAVAHVYGSLAAQYNRLPIIHTKHGNQLPFQNRKNYLLTRIAGILTDRLVAVSEQIKNTVIQGYKMNPKKMIVIRNGINLANFNGSVNQEQIRLLKDQVGIRKDSFVIGNIARLSPEKDHATLLKAFRNLVRKDIHAELIIVGDGMLSEALKKLAKEFGIKEHVKFLGERNDVAHLLRIFDVFILSSTEEGIPLTILEAMAAGKPVIATQTGGSSEVVVDGETGYLVPCREPEEIELAVLRFYNDRGLIQKMGEAGLRRIRENFTIEQMMEAYQKVYESVRKKQ